MDTILQELTILPGVMGCYVFIKDAGVACSNLPESFTEEMATEAAVSLNRMLQMAEVKGLAPQSISITYDKFIVLSMPINPTATLMALCDPGGNVALAATTVCMLAPELNKAVAQQVSNTEQSTPAEEEAPSKQKSDTAIDNEKTTAAMEQIKTALFQTVGPIADIVFDDCLETWTRNNPADISRIFELIGCLSGEIDNPDLFEEFKGKISSLL